MRLKNIWKRGYANKHVKAKTKQTKIRVFWVTASHMLEQVCVRMSSTYVRRLDLAYVDPKNPNQHRNSERTKQDIKCKT